MKTDRKTDYDLAVCTLASGSKGNAIYVSDGETALLVDAGLSGKKIEERMHRRRLDPSNLDAILVSHEHTDHLRGVGILSRRYRLPVYINTATREAAAAQLGTVREYRDFSVGTGFAVNGIDVHPFSLSHDASDPAGFTFRRNGTKIGLATDLGVATAMVREHLKQCRVLIMEANHDVKMLEQGPYPWPLKQRIRSRLGHLSNDDTRRLLEEMRHDGLQHVVLAHLSETNNTPEKARAAVAGALAGSKTRLSVALQETPGEMIFAG